MVIGLLLGGVLGLGTVVYALAIGPLTQLMLPWFTVDVLAPAAQPARVRDQVGDHADADRRSTPASRPVPNISGSAVNAHTSKPRATLEKTPVGTPPAGVLTIGAA